MKYLLVILCFANLSFQIITDNSFSYNLKFEDKIEKVISTTRNYPCLFDHNIIDTIKSTKPVVNSHIQQIAIIKLKRNYAKDSIEFSIINFKYLQLDGKQFKINSNLVQHFFDVMPKYYYDSLSFHTKEND